MEQTDELDFLINDLERLINEIIDKLKELEKQYELNKGLGE